MKNLLFSVLPCIFLLGGRVLAQDAPAAEEVPLANPAQPETNVPGEVGAAPVENPEPAVDPEALARAEAARLEEENASWVKIDLSEQKAYLYKEGKEVTVTSISSGKSSRPTPRGTFKVSEKDKWHRSGRYGSYVSKSGRTVRGNVDTRKSSPPRGSYYKGASMFYFLRFNGPIGMHAGYLPGYPASHGCVRLPSSQAKVFYAHCGIGTRVVVQE